MKEAGDFNQEENPVVLFLSKAYQLINTKIAELAKCAGISNLIFFSPDIEKYTML